MLNLLCTALVLLSGATACKPSGSDAPPRVELASAGTVTLPAARPADDSGAPELPRAFVDTKLVAPTGRRVAVNAGDDLQRALDQAQPGDVLLLEAGATFTGNFQLPAKPGAQWITVRSAAPDARLPPPGTRVTPRQADLLPKIVSPNERPALRTMAGAHHWRLIALEIAVDPSVATNYGLLRFGDSPQTLAEVPHHLILDRSYVHGQPETHLKHCVALNGASNAVIDSYLSECHGKGQDTQAILGWNGPGPFKIVNNYLEGAGENVMFGGSDPSIHDLVPSDIEFRQNHVTKPLRWKGRWTVKNLFELKNARRVLIEGNLFENSWVDGQVGFAIVIKSSNQNGKCPWCGTQDVTMRYNRIRNASNGINVSARPQGPAVPVSRVLIAHNIVDRLGVPPFGGAARMFQLLGDVRDLTIEHNTLLDAKLLVLFDGSEPLVRFVFRDNAAQVRGYGVKGSGTPEGTRSLARYAPDAEFRGNAITGVVGNRYPAGNSFPGSLSGTAAGADAARVRSAVKDAATN